jgi:hypothetical protein
MSEAEIRSAHLNRYQAPALIGGAGCLILVIVGGFFSGDMFFRSWLFAWIFWLGVALGSLVIVMLHHMTGGGWGYLLRRFGEAAALTLPIIALLFIPMIIGVRYVYPWASHAPEFLNDPIVQHKTIFLNVPFWIARLVLYFAVFFVLAWSLRRISLEGDRAGYTSPLLKRFTNISAAGILIYFVLMSLGAVDWIMSREPHWYSTVFGFLICIGQAISGMSFLLLMVALFSRDPAYAPRLLPNYLNDMGNVLLTFVILWAYLGLAQFLIIWLGDIQHEITWYIRRTDGGWRWVAGALIAFHFLVPFLLLLQRPLKRKIGILASIAGFMFFIHILDVIFMITPTGRAPHPVWWWALAQLMNLGAWLGMGGIFVAVFLWFLSQAPVVPIGAPVLSVDHAHGQRTAPGTVA